MEIKLCTIIRPSVYHKETNKEYDHLMGKSILWELIQSKIRTSSINYGIQKKQKIVCVEAGLITHQ